MKTSGIVVRRALDDDADLARRRNGAGLRDRHFDPWRAELANHDAADGRRERLDHLIMRCADELHEPFRELLVIQGAGDAVAGGRDAGVRADLEVDADDLLDAPFPFPEADDRLDAKLAKENLVHCCPLSYGGGASSSSGQRGLATILGICAPSARRHHPAYAIMAPLSVHSAGLG